MYFPNYTEEQFSTQISSLHFLTESLYHSVRISKSIFSTHFRPRVKQNPCNPIWKRGSFFGNIDNGTKKLTIVLAVILLENTPPTSVQRHNFELHQILLPSLQHHILSSQCQIVSLFWQNLNCQEFVFGVADVLLQQIVSHCLILWTMFNNGHIVLHFGQPFVHLLVLCP